MKFITNHEVQDWYMQSTDLAAGFKSIGLRSDEVTMSGMPHHLQVAIRHRMQLDPEQNVPVDLFASISYFSLCKGLFLSLSGLSEHRATELFGFRSQARSMPASSSHAELIKYFLRRDIGLTFCQKMACLLGDPFFGRRSMFRRDSLLRLLQSISLQSRSNLLDQLARAGDIAVLFAQHAAVVRRAPPLTAAEVLSALHPLPDLSNNQRYDLLRSLLERCGRIEAYFLAKLVMRSAGFGFEYQGELLAEAIAEHFQITTESVQHAIALTDPIHVAQILEREGPAGLRTIQLKPLSPVRPALASTGSEISTQFPVWVERKYDGIRLLLHKSTDATGATLCGAYTRNRKDWLEMVPGLERSLMQVPAGNAIIDGELHGSVLDLEGARPATVYEVYSVLQGEPIRPVSLKFAAFDLLYLNNSDLTGLPLHRRRSGLSSLIGPMLCQPLPLPFSIADGQIANTKEEVNRLFHHFRAQGYEGIIAKNLSGEYHIASRDPSWIKRKPEITLDLVITGGLMAVTSKANAGMFGSYLVAARNDAADSGFEMVGDVAGLDVARDRQIQNDVLQRGLLTGRKFERPSASGTRPGWEFLPQIVVTVKFEGIIHEAGSGKLSLRDPKIAMIRADKSAHEADTVRDIEELYLNQRLS